MCRVRDEMSRTQEVCPTSGCSPTRASCARLSRQPLGSEKKDQPFRQMGSSRRTDRPDVQMEVCVCFNRSSLD